jgi:hypothetical protein
METKYKKKEKESLEKELSRLVELTLRLENELDLMNYK